jgi:hypothetical protein
MRSSHLHQYTALVKNLLSDEIISKKENRELVEKEMVDQVLLAL